MMKSGEMTYIDMVIAEVARIREYYFGEMTSYDGDVLDTVLALLKAQQPRVLTLEEANTFEVVWSEDRGTNTVFPCLVKNNMNDSKLYKYGIQWRVWSARPTDEQRKAVKWDG